MPILLPTLFCLVFHRKANTMKTCIRGRHSIYVERLLYYNKLPNQLRISKGDAVSNKLGLANKFLLAP